MATNPLLPVRGELLTELRMMPDFQMRHEHLLDHQAYVRALPRSHCVPALRIPQLSRPVWVRVLAGSDGRFRFAAHCADPLTRGLVGLLARLYDGAEHEAVFLTSPRPLVDGPLTQSLTARRRADLQVIATYLRRAAVQETLRGRQFRSDLRSLWPALGLELKPMRGMTHEATQTE